MHVRQSANVRSKLWLDIAHSSETLEHKCGLIAMDTGVPQTFLVLQEFTLKCGLTFVAWEVSNTYI